MSNQVQAIQKELTRVRKLKRASEAEVELLRSDMEKGKIHIRINPEIKKDLAEALVEIYQLGYDSRIHTNYYTDGDRIYKESASANWNNWSQDDNFKIVAVMDVLHGNNQRYGCWDEWDYRILKGCIDVQYWTEMEESDDYDDIIYFLQEEHPDVYDEFLSEQRAIAYEFFLREIPDEYCVEINQ
jgi:hypothetical protein